MTSAAPNMPHGLLTVAAFLAWDSGDDSGRLWQLRDGVPEAMAPASENHGAIQGELAAIIRNHLLAHRPDCRVIVAPSVMPQVRASINARVPDIAVTCQRARGAQLMEAPVLLVEILSPSNASKTWANVWAYTTIPSAGDILVISSTDVAAELLRRGPDGIWPRDATPLAAGDTLNLASIGLDLPLIDAYRTTDLAG